MSVLLRKSGCLWSSKPPFINYYWGDDLLGLDPDWYDSIERATLREPHLLQKTRVELEPAARDGRVILAVYWKMDKCGGSDWMQVRGSIALWKLECDETGSAWFELGTFWVNPIARYGETGYPVGDTLYRLMLEMNKDRNILGTTTNPKAIHTGMRHGMQMIRFTQLPRGVHTATCICPVQKTGAINNALCRLKDRDCRVRVSTETWMRLGQPDLLPFP